MKKHNLVIDASVARASGGTEATHPTSVVTRDFLLAVLTICHKVVMTPAILDEWNQHQSGFARKWRRSMVARKKLIPLDVEERQDLRQQVELEKVTQEQKNAMLKDCHLVEAAIYTDRRVISLDDTARKLFVGLSDNFAELQNVLWVNPVAARAEVINWLEGKQDGAVWALAHQ